MNSESRVHFADCNFAARQRHTIERERAELRTTRMGLPSRSTQMHDSLTVRTIKQWQNRIGTQGLRRGGTLGVGASTQNAFSQVPSTRSTEFGNAELDNGEQQVSGWRWR
eukprot:IDg20112t1